VIFYFVCDDADQMHAELTDRGLTLAAPKTAYYGMRQVTVPDPDGYVLCFENPTTEA
jgi:predicted enzyme related to lactoylglutathione lyase